MDQYDTAKTTKDSKLEGRLKEDVSLRKRKRIKKVLNKYQNGNKT